MTVVAFRCTCSVPPAQQAQQTQPPAQPSRRRSLLALPALAWTVAAWEQGPALASENAGGVDSSTSPLIQELLRKTEEKKAERAKERLDDYYRRNFSDYLSFQASGAPANGGTENQQRIKEWLERNQEPALPVEAAAKRRQQAQ